LNYWLRNCFAWGKRARIILEVDAHVIQPEEYDELPESGEAFLEHADLYEGEKLIRAGRQSRKPQGIVVCPA